MSDFLKGRRVVEVRGLLWLLSDDQAIDRQILSTGGWEGDVDAYFEQHLKPGMAVLDIGANIGWYTMLAAKLVGLGGSVTAFEPTDAHNLLEIHAILNGFDDRIECFKEAVGCSAGCRVGFFAYSYPLGTEPSASYRLAETWFRPLDGLYAHYDLVKIDVDGYEAEVIQSGLRFFKKNRPRIVLEVGKQVATLEASNNAVKLGLESVFENLAELGYEIRSSQGYGYEVDYRLCQEIFENPDIGSMNLFCEPKSSSPYR